MNSRRRSHRKSRRRHCEWFRLRADGTRWLAVFVVTAGSVLGALWFFTRHSHVPIIDPPIIDVTRCSPAVVQAILTSRAAIQRSPHSADAWGHLAMFLVAHQFESDAIPCFEQAARLDPENYRWPYLLGVTLLVSDREAAVAQFRRAVHVSDDVGVAQNRLGELLLDLGRYDEAEIYLRHAQRLQPNEVRPCLGLARLANARGDMSEALEWANCAVRLSPQERVIHELLASLHQQSMNRQLAIRELEIVESLPDQPLSWNDPVAAEVVKLRQDAQWSVDQAESMLARHQVIEAVRLLERTLRRDSQNPRVACALARALIQLGRVADAAVILDQAGQTHGQIAEIHFQCGVIYFLQDHHNDALQAFQRAIEIKPDYALAHYNLGHTLEYLGNSEAALRAFRAAVHYRPTHQGAHTNAGRILLEKNQPTEALQHLRVSVRLAPDDQLSRQLFHEATQALGADK
jgi:tetratricopeptide (TPR) repeat protein